MRGFLSLTVNNLLCSKQVQQELKKSLDLLKSAVNRAPMVTLATEWDMSSDATEDIPPFMEAVQGPDMPRPGESWTAVPSVSMEEVVEVSMSSAPKREEGSIEREESAGHDGNSTSLGGSKLNIIGDEGGGEEDGNSVVSQREDKSEEADVVPVSVQSNATTKGSTKPSPKKKSSSASTVEKKKKKKKSSGESHNSAVYGIERALLSYRSNDTLLAEYLSTLDCSTVFPSQKSSVLEADVVVDLLVAISRCFGTLQGKWEVVLTWFHSACSISSFGFVKSLFSEQQISQLHDSLNLCQQNLSGGDIHSEILTRVKLAYGMGEKKE